MTGNHKPSLFILFLLVSLASVNAVLFTPALPQIQTFFHVSVEIAQLTITIFLLGYALGQLPYGPLANGLGRKKALLIGILIATIGSFCCAFSYHTHLFSLLIIGRFLQAIGASAGLKISFTMIADTVAQTEATKMLSKLITAFAVMPGVAIAIGGFLTQFFGWESCFYFLAFFCLGVLLLSLRLPETAPSIDPKALIFSSIIHGYLAKLKNHRLIASAFLMGCCTTTVYVFASKAPFIGINLIGLTPQTFGLYNLLPAVGMLLGSLLAAKIAGRIELFKLLIFNIFGVLFCSSLMLLLFAFNFLSISTLFFPLIAIYMFENVILANIISYGLSNAKNKANASAMLNFINIGLTVVIVLLSEFIYPEKALILPIIFVILSFFMFVLWRILKRQSNDTEF